MTAVPGELSAALVAALPLLRCPQCAAAQTGPDDAALQADEKGQIGCAAGHRFDRARQGYLPLLAAGARTDTGDDAAMVAARAQFLDRGHYAPIAGAVADAVGPDGPTGDRRRICEIGAGTAYYLAGVLGEGGVGLAVDSSRYAARRAVAAHPRVAGILADAWAPLPVRDGALDAVLVVFAPRTPTEIRRVLRPGGVAVVVTPGPGHLAQVRQSLGMLEVDEHKQAAVRGQFDGLLAFDGVRQVSAGMRLQHGDLRNLVGMGPAARHRSDEQIAAAVATLPDSVEVGIEVSVSRFVAA